MENTAWSNQEQHLKKLNLYNITIIHNQHINCSIYRRETCNQIRVLLDEEELIVTAPSHPANYINKAAEGMDNWIGDHRRYQITISPSKLKGYKYLKKLIGRV